MKAVHDRAHVGDSFVWLKLQQTIRVTKIDQYDG